MARRRTRIGLFRLARRVGRGLQCRDRAPSVGPNAFTVNQRAVECQLGLQELPGAHLGHCP
eukprot:104523-Pyramimonas_sp.AAC.1